jgi:DinB family protein
MGRLQTRRSALLPKSLESGTVNRGAANLEIFAGLPVCCVDSRKLARLPHERPSRASKLRTSRRIFMTSNTATMSAPAFAGSGPAASAADQKLTTSELEQALLYLEQTRKYAIGAVKGLFETQWHFKPAPDRWSIAENVEHIVVVQERVLGPIRDQLAKSAAASRDRDYQKVDAIVINQFPGRLARFQSPEFVHPVGQFTRSEALDRLLKNCARLTEHLESARDLRQHALDAPPLKPVSQGAYESMDGYQWLLAAAAHTERHIKQILEVRAEPHFPEL